MTGNPHTKTVLGLMSGTSLDGLDMALCQFEKTNGAYSFRIVKAKTVDYSGEWKKRLTEAKDISALNYFELNAQYGNYIASEVNAFLNDSEKPDVIASHGHTVFHQPQLGFSTQIGCGATIAAKTGIATVCDFRSLDIANGGQGAPLVPIGDKFLFSQYDACLNLGGIANGSFDKDGKRIAYDICEANMLLNYLSQKEGKEFDKGGEMARAGKIDEALLLALNNFPYYSQPGAKSIGREWFEKNSLPLMEKSKLNTNDLLATSVEHMADIIANELISQTLKTVLVTGGGAYNSFLMERLKAKTACELILPSNEIINFKEALIFAFLGYLRVNDTINTLASVTGAQGNSIGGAVYLAV